MIDKKYLIVRGIVMYCDFCGKNLAGYVKYCRHCGRRLKDRLEDTRPLPVVDERMLTLNTVKRQAAHSLSWSNLALQRRFPFNKGQMQKLIYGIISFAIIVVLVYIIMTFKTLEEYQILTALWATVLTVYTWRKSR
ncbi:hypothetical protein [Sporomusa sphaeroides]|jgi:uncharacterized membrane protein YvbJ